MNWLWRWVCGLANLSNWLNEASSSFSQGPDIYRVGLSWTRSDFQLIPTYVFAPGYVIPMAACWDRSGGAWITKIES